MNDTIEPRTSCLTLMPDKDSNLILYQNEIKPAIEMAGFTSVRLDDVASSELLISTIWKTIHDAHVIIADLSGKNPNVFYELGIAHALGKPVLMLAQSIDDVPFDLRHLRVIRYDQTLTEATQLRKRILEALREMKRSAEDFVPLIAADLITTEPDRDSKAILADAFLANAESARKTAKPKEAIKILQQSAELYKQIGNDHGLATALNNLVLCPP